MDMGTVALFLLGWLAVAVVVSLVLGMFLQRAHTTSSEHELEVMAEQQRVVRYLRKPRTKSSPPATTAVSLDDDASAPQHERKHGQAV